MTAVLSARKWAQSLSIVIDLSINSHSGWSTSNKPMAKVTSISVKWYPMYARLQIA